MPANALLCDIQRGYGFHAALTVRSTGPSGGRRAGLLLDPPPSRRMTTRIYGVTTGSVKVTARVHGSCENRIDLSN